MCNEKEKRWLNAIIDWIDKHGSLAHQIAMLFENNVAHREHERMSRMNHLRKWHAGFIKRTDCILREADSLVTF